MFVYRYVYFITIFNRIGRFVIIKSILIRKCNCKILNIETNGWILNEKVFFLARERFFLSSNIHIHAMSSFWVGYSENVIYAASHTRSSCLLACCGCCCCRLFLFIHSFVLLHVPVFVDILKNHARENETRDKEEWEGNRETGYIQRTVYRYPIPTLSYRLTCTIPSRKPKNFKLIATIQLGNHIRFVVLLPNEKKN